MQNGALVADVVTTWLAKAERRPTLCFAVDRVHAKTLQAQFTGAGVQCGYIDAMTPLDEREAVRKAFQAGRLDVVCNVGVLTTGVDWDVRCIVLARPTKSEILFTQIIGRGLRTAPGKDYCLILDHSDTTLRLGFVTDIHHDKLNDGTMAESAKDPQERVGAKPKECPVCHYVRAPGVQSCPSCGHVAERSTEVQTVDGELVDLSTQRKANKVDWDEKIAFIASLKRYQIQTGKKPGWVAQKYKTRFGVWPNDPRVNHARPAEKVAVEVRNWITGQNIRFAKAKGRAA
jgi:DNA repair protein RadD